MGLLAAWLTTGHAAVAANRAFIVGINNYANLTPLVKAVNDARAIAATLQGLGYQTTLLIDGQADRLPFFTAWEQFLSTVQAGDTVVVFFSGHGLQLSGANYLMPRDVLKTEHGEGVTREFSISFNTLLEGLERKKPRVTLHILDACRDNPFTLPEGKKSVGSAAGLAELRNVEGAFIMYSAGAQQQALDWLTETDPDPNSVYTRRLLPLLKTPGLSLVDIAKRVQSQVAEDARTKYVVKGRKIAHEQRPAYYDGIVGHFYPAGPGGVAATAPAIAPVAAATGIIQVPAKLPQVAAGGSGARDGAPPTAPGLTQGHVAQAARTPDGSVVLKGLAGQGAAGAAAAKPAPNVSATVPGTPPPGALTDPAVLFGQKGQAARGQAAAAPTAPPETSVCIRVGSRLERPLQVRVGSNICASNGTGHATVLDITSHSVTYSGTGGPTTTCRKTEICAFHWDNAPSFSVAVGAPPAGQQKSATLMPSTR